MLLIKKKQSQVEPYADITDDASNNIDVLLNEDSPDVKKTNWYFGENNFNSQNSSSFVYSNLNNSVISSDC